MGKTSPDYLLKIQRFIVEIQKNSLFSGRPSSFHFKHLNGWKAPPTWNGDEEAEKKSGFGYLGAEL